MTAIPLAGRAGAPRFFAAILCAGAAAACVPGRAPRLAPQRADAVAEARAALAVAAGDRDLAGVLRHITPNARLVHGADSQDLRAAITTVFAFLPEGTTPELWFAPRHLRRCDAWAYETGGRAGLNVFTAGAPAVSHRYKYAIAWTSDSATGRALIERVALIRTRDTGTPTIAGCRPTPREQLQQRRAGIAVTPGFGFFLNSVGSDLEAQMRSRNLKVRSISEGLERTDEPGFFAPPMVAAWIRPWRGLGVEAIWTAGPGRAATAAADTTNLAHAGFQFEQTWTALVGTLRWRDLKIGAGPAYVREAWHVSVDALAPLPGGNFAAVSHVADAGTTTNRIGVFAQASLAVPLTPRLYADVRAFTLAVGESRTPAAFNFAPATIKSANIGLGVLIGWAF